MYKVTIIDQDTGKTVTGIQTEAVLCGYTLDGLIGVDLQLSADPGDVAQLIMRVQDDIEELLKEYPIVDWLLRAYRKGRGR